jgi:UDP-3-O-acyl-N-acetylglucosamine deacetylase
MTVKLFAEMSNAVSEWAESGTDEQGKDYVKCLVCARTFGFNVSMEYVLEHLQACNNP